MSAPASRSSQHTSRLSRRLGLADAVGIGLGAMLGAGVFAAPAPAAALAGPGILLAVVIAGAVAYANATSTARLAAAQPEAGGVYAFGRKRIGKGTGFAAGWAFIAGKLASLTAMALAFGAYVLPDHQRLAGIGAVIALTLVNLSGVQRTARTATIGGLLVGLTLLITGTGELVGTDGRHGGSLDHLRPITGTGGLHGLLGAAGIMFFAFAGYARIATLGEEVRDPAKTIPRAVPIALAIAFAIYSVAMAGALVAIGPESLSHARAPLEAAARAGVGEQAASVIRTAAAVAVVGVLLSLLAGVSRTAFAMAADGELPRPLARVTKRTKVPGRAQVATAAVVIAAVLVVPTAKAIATSSLLILGYYAIAHLSALRLPAEARPPRLIAPVGLFGCATLALNLPIDDVLAGAVIVAAGLAARAVAGLVRSGSDKLR